MTSITTMAILILNQNHPIVIAVVTDVILTSSSHHQQHDDRLSCPLTLTAHSHRSPLSPGPPSLSAPLPQAAQLSVWPCCRS